MARVLLITENEQIRLLLRALIETDGHQVSEARSGAEALGAIELRPDSIFVDIDLPSMSGAQFLVALRQHPTLGLTPATFITAHPDRIAARLPEGMAEASIIAKPFRPDDVRSALGRMLSSFSRNNIRVSLHPSIVRVEAAGVKGTALRVGTDVIIASLQGDAKPDHKYQLRLTSATDAVTLDVVCIGKSRGQTRFAITKDDAAVKRVQTMMEHLIADRHAVPDHRREERTRITSAVAWERSGDRQQGILRDLSASGAYVVASTLPPVASQVVVYLAGHGKKQPDVSGCMARIARHGSDGFGCEFVAPPTSFMVALNSLLSEAVNGPTALRNTPS